MSSPHEQPSAAQAEAAQPQRDYVGELYAAGLAPAGLLDFFNPDPKTQQTIASWALGVHHLGKKAGRNDAATEAAAEAAQAAMPKPPEWKIEPGQTREAAWANSYPSSVTFMANGQRRTSLNEAGKFLADNLGGKPDVGTPAELMRNPAQNAGAAREAVGYRLLPAEAAGFAIAPTEVTGQRRIVVDYYMGAPMTIAGQKTHGELFFRTVVPEGEQFWFDEQLGKDGSYRGFLRAAAMEALRAEAAGQRNGPNEGTAQASLELLGIMTQVVNAANGPIIRLPEQPRTFAPPSF